MSKSRVSTLIFCKDKIDNLVGLIQDVYPVSDEIVIVDSSTPDNKQLLLQKKEDLKLDKVTVYPVVALGHPEPYQMYGLGKCQHDWVFYIDTDERPNEFLKRNMRSIIESVDNDAFLVRKRELSKDGKRFFDSYQRRLYKRESATYTGNVFSDPTINGKEVKLDPNNFLNHYFEYYDNPAKSYNGYFVICAYEARKSYDDLLDITKTRPLARAFLEAYYKARDVKSDEELTKFDYKFLQMSVLYVGGELSHNLKKGKLPNIGFVSSNYVYVMKEIDSLFTHPIEERQTQLAISKEIRSAGGVIKYLGVDEPYVHNLRSEYDTKGINGVQLFTSLLRKEHEKRQRERVRMTSAS